MMDPLRAKLTLRFAYQFRYLNQNLYSYSLPQGWRTLFEQLCVDVDAELTDSEKAQFHWQQIKEKFGELRAYASYGDKIRQLRPDAAADERPTLIKGIADETRERITAIVGRVGEQSMKTCVFCGALGELRTSHAWVIPTCAVHIKSSRHDFPSDV